MSKPMTNIVNFVRDRRQRDELASDARKLAEGVERVYHHVGDHLEKMAVLARKHGLRTLLAELPEDVATSFLQVQAGIAQAWGQMSEDAVPEFPLEPVEEPEPDESGEPNDPEIPDGSGGEGDDAGDDTDDGGGA